MAVLVAYAAGAAVGGAIGGTFLGVSAAAWGGIVATTAYNLAFAPTPHTEGPRLTDLKAAQVSYGSVIPYVEGHPRLGGVIAWASVKREIANTTEQGGSGGGATSTTYTYEQDVLYILSENEVANLHSVFWNGELVWTRSEDADADSQQDNSERWSRLTFYSGAADQLPDPTYEAAVGVGNAPAYRGRSSVFIEGLQLGASGQLPNLTFVVSPEPSIPVAGCTQILHDFALTDYAFAAPRGAAVQDGELKVWGIRSGDVITYTADPDTYALGATSTDTIPAGATIDEPGQMNGDRCVALFGGATGHVYLAGDGIAHDFTITGTPAVGTSALRGSTRGGKLVVASGSSNLYVFSDLTGTYAGAATNSHSVESLSFTDSTIYLLSGGMVYPFDATTFAAGTAFAAPDGTGLRIYTGTDGELCCTNAAAQVFTWSGSEWTPLVRLQSYDGADLGTASCIHVVDGADVYAIRTYDNPDPITRVLTTLDQDCSTIAFDGLSVGFENVETFNPPGDVAGWTDVKGYAVGWTWDDRGSVGGNLATITPTWDGVHVTTYAGGTTPADLIHQGTSGLIRVGVINEVVPFCRATGLVRWTGQAPPDGFQEQYHDVYKTTGDLVSLNEPTLQEVVERQCVRGGLSLDYVDASDLAVRNVHAMVISQISSPRQIIEMLATAYLFTAVESEVLRFQFRGSASVATITYDELVMSGDGEPLPISKANDLELPVQVNVKFSNLMDDYQDGAESSDRLTSSGQNVTVVELPLGFTPTEAKQIADAHVTIAPAEALTVGPFSLTRDYARLEPSDVITVTDSTGATHRIRLRTKKEVAGVLTFEAVSDNANAVISVAATSSEGYTYSTSVQLPVDTDVELLDIPILRDEDDDVGFYAVAKPATDVAFPGCVLFKSPDDASFTSWKAVETEGVFGTATTTLASGVVGLFDEANSVTVDVGIGALSSTTRDAILGSGANAILIGSEILCFRDATFVSTGVYTLTGLLRGLRGTEWAVGTHVADERVVLLDSNIRRVPMTNSELGVEEYWKAVTQGRTTSTADSEAFTDTGIGKKPFAPINVRRAISGADAVITWDRRSRLEDAPLTGSIPLGEESESWEIDITVSGTLTTYPTTTGSLTVTGGASSLIAGSTIAVYQMSALVGRGYAGQLTL